METKSNSLKTILLLMGSFTFAFLLGEMVHEMGHFMAHRFFGVEGISIHLDPFGGSKILGVEVLPPREMMITTAAGPGLNLIAGVAAALLIWRYSRPVFLPLLLWGPVALIQEGVNLSLGLLSYGSDARWLAYLGTPRVLLIVLGVAFILGGTAWISRVLYRNVDFAGKTFPARLALAFFGLGFLMILRAVVSFFQSPAAAIENSVPLLFALILAALISGTQGIWGSREKEERSSIQVPAWSSSLTVFGMGLGILILQIILP